MKIGGVPVATGRSIRGDPLRQFCICTRGDKRQWDLASCRDLLLAPFTPNSPKLALRSFIDFCRGMDVLGILRYSSLVFAAPKYHSIHYHQRHYQNHREGKSKTGQIIKNFAFRYMPDHVPSLKVVDTLRVPSQNYKGSRHTPCDVTQLQR